MIGNGTQTFIMGPCAVESLEQVRQVGQAMKDQGLKLMRGGVFQTGNISHTISKV
ncbi:hypothetical protein ACT7CW_02660 [Bacillus pacificus]